MYAKTHSSHCIAEKLTMAVTLRKSLVVIYISILFLFQSCESLPAKEENGKFERTVLNKDMKNLLKRLLKEMRGEVTSETDGSTNKDIKFSKSDIDQKHVDKDSDLEDLLETMSCNGNKAVGIHPELKETIKAMNSEEKYEELQQENNNNNNNMQQEDNNNMQQESNNIQQEINNTKRNFVPTIAEEWVVFERRWEDAFIPYYIDFESFSDENKEKVQRVLNEAEADYLEKTCVVLQQISLDEVKSGQYKYFVNVTNLPSGCHSVMGKQSWGALMELPPGQIISLKENTCLQTRTVIHEFGHALGMAHEQMRTDRDKHIKILYENIEDHNEIQFSKQTTLDKNPYDFNSIMQYNLLGGGVKTWDKTMAFSDPDLEFLAGHSKRLTFYDVMDITKAYHCTKHCDHDIPCINGGFMDHTCRCRCPEGITGKHCDKFVSEKGYCGGIIDLVPGKEITITSPNYPNNYDEGKICYWLLRAENPDQRVMIEVEDFDVSHNEDLCRCYNWLEVRYNLVAQPGPKYCGSHFERNKISTTEFGNSDLMMLIFDTATVTGVNSSRGFTLKARAVVPNSAGCRGAPPDVPKSSNNLKDIKGAVGDVVEYTCDYRYQMLGKNSVTCEADGTWTKERFRCVKNDPLFECSFEDGDCGITFQGTFSWLIESEENEKFLTVSHSYAEQQAVASFTVPVVLKADVTYCLSLFFTRFDDKEPCASLNIGDLNHNYIPWFYGECKKLYRTHFIGDYGPYDKDMHMQVIFYLPNGGYFNAAVDEIRLTEGSC